ncbi:sugar nucleotide-binding protein [Aquirufa ecclesiirivi]
MDKKIIVLGSKGMLGQMVIKYFGALGYSITEFNERINEHNIFQIINSINKLDDSLVINCIGKIKQKSDDAFTLLWSNSILPMELARSLKKSHFLIQPSTDCVFTGDREESYEINDFNDAVDVYGWSKSLGEQALQHRTNTLIVRVSIIGPDYNSDKGLLSWFLNLEEESTVNGFTNHLWNGITTLEWCKFLEDYILSKKVYPLNTIQLGTKEIYSKYDMLNLFKKVFNKNLEINPLSEGAKVQKCLVPTIFCQDLNSQLVELSNEMNNI